MSIDNKIKEANIEKVYHLLGWVLFLICAVFFILASIKDFNAFSLIGSIIFLVGCVIFIIPLVKKK